MNLRDTYHAPRPLALPFLLTRHPGSPLRFPRTCASFYLCSEWIPHMSRRYNPLRLREYFVETFWTLWGPSRGNDDSQWA